MLTVEFELIEGGLYALSRRGDAKAQPLKTTKNCSEPKSPSPPPSLASTPPLEGRSKVFVRGISRKMMVISLQSAFSKLGPVQKVDAYPTRGYAIVEFKRHETAELAISAHWHIIDGEFVEIRPFIPKMKSKKSTEEQETL
ncbi:Heterogeneou nuclear ribonucleoprotein A3 [Taenia solium]|eukprot:TsM_000706900 transcript=TsM_000706900 gene=TsM_000706900